MNDNILRILICIAAVGITALLMRLNNNRKTRRALQYPFPVIAAAVLAAEILLLTFLRPEITALLSSVPLFAWLFTAGGLVFGAEILFWNLLAVWVFLLLKLFLRPVVSSLCRRKNFRGIEKRYEPAREEGLYHLKNSAVNLRRILGILTVLLGVCTAAVCSLAWISGPGGLLWLYMYPAAAWVIVSERYWFLSGWTTEEYRNRVGGEDPSELQHTDYSKLRQVFEALFPDPLLTSGTSRIFDNAGGTADLLRRLEASDDRVERLAAGYFLNLPQRKEGAFDSDMIGASIGLLRGQSTVVFDPFYRDMDDYITLPMMDTLLSGRKILVICGRQSIIPDVSEWIGGVMQGYCRTDRLWRTGVLDGKTDLDIGILGFSNLYDVRIINNSDPFLNRVGFILLIEPSRMLTTAQAGLGIVAGKLDTAKKPVFCALDRESDGIVDLLSHLFLQNVTNVVAAPPIKPLYTAMGWNASGNFHRQSLFQNETHYLGNGVELAATALKYQVPQVSWYSEEKAPVLDLHWITLQYYRQISQYADIPCRQSVLDGMIRFIPNPLNSPVSESAFLIAEDECCNLFSTVRAYLTRATRDLFVNVMSENYLLRDYMRCNWRLFMNDAKAIPLITPHYAKTERNTVQRLIIMMAGGPVREDYVRHEMQMLGYRDKDVYHRISLLISRYFGTSHTVITVSDRKEYTVEDIPVSVMYYSIPMKKFETEFASTLKTAYFVVEDEKLETEHIDARMFQHITQLVMPGQQIIHGGKAYRVFRVSPDVGCILHRSADLYTSRLYYRQLRTYALGREKSSQIISRRTVGDLDVTLENIAFSVSSSGYLEMKDAGSLISARVVDLSEDPSVLAGTYKRNYSAKTIIKLKLRGTDEHVRYTLCLLLQELFRTIFPYSWPFIAVLCEKPEDVGGMLRHLTYDLAPFDENNGVWYDREAVYILEDSVMDLGLLEAVDTNLTRLFEILADYLNWLGEKEEGSSPEEAGEFTPELPFDPPWKRSSIFSLFRRRKKGGPSDGDGKNEKDKDPGNAEDKPGDAEDKPAGAEDKPGDGAPAGGKDGVKVTDEDDPADIPDEEPDKTIDGKRLPPSENTGDGCFLKFGGTGIDPAIAADDLKEYLNSHGCGDNSLRQARDPAALDPPHVSGELVCDFCGCSLTGVRYDRLSDGRIRCGKCTSTAITDLKSFERLLLDAVAILENNYGITFGSGITVHMTDAKTVSKVSGVVFRPTSGFDPRAVGVATQSGPNSYAIYIEHGSPRMATLTTMIHELTHIWQFQNWDMKKVQKHYGKKNLDYILEGMAVWAEIQTLYAIGEYTYARDREQRIEDRPEVYRIGAEQYIKKYPFDRYGNIRAEHPFNTYPPL